MTKISPLSRDLALAAWLASLGAAACSGSAPSPSAGASDGGALAIDSPDAGAAPCDSEFTHDAAAFLQRATCSVGGADGGAPLTSCAEWSQNEEGDWEPFLEQCANANGVPSTAPCPSAGRVGSCVGAATCTSQMVTRYYDADAGAAGQAACQATPGATWVVP
jgi:hypothetical protein